MQGRRRNDLHKLDVYRAALQLYRKISLMVRQFPKGEADLKKQMKRASRSVPFNIGEGVGKRGRARASSYEIALGEAKELIVALDCVEIDELAPVADVVEAQDLVDRISAMLTKMIRAAETTPATSMERAEARGPCPVCRDRDRDRDRDRRAPPTGSWPAAAERAGAFPAANFRDG